MVALRSPYLLSNARLREAAAGGKPLGEGERSPAVAQMQAALLDLGYGPGGTAPGQVMDGAFGAHTAELVKAFQRDRGLASTGVLDMGTLIAADIALAVKTPMTPSHQSRVGRTAITPSAQSAGRNTPPIGPSTPRPQARPVARQRAWHRVRGGSAPATLFLQHRPGLQDQP